MMLTIAQVSQRLNVSAYTVSALIHRGQLPAVKLGHWRIDTDDLEAFLRREKARQQPVVLTPSVDADRHFAPSASVEDWR